MEKPCTVLKELHETKTKALKTVNTFCYCLQATYSFNSLLFAQLILAIVILDIIIIALKEEEWKSTLKNPL